MESTPPSSDDRRRSYRTPVVSVDPIVDHSLEPSVEMNVSVVADLQDSLLVAMNDLKRLEGLLDHATSNLLDRFNTAMQVLTEQPATDNSGQIAKALHAAVTELQFHDMASQLLVHTGKVLQGCAYKLAEQAMEPDEEEAGVVMLHMPDRPNPVTQSEMDSGSIELF